MATQRVELQHEAEYIGRAVDPEKGKNPKSGKMELRLFMEIIDGPLAGRRVKWTANMKEPKTIAYAKRDMVAAGWQGKDVNTFVTDVVAATASGRKLPFVVRLASNGVREDGSPNEWWTVGSIGTGATPLVPTSSDDDSKMNSWFAEAGDIPTRTEQSAGRGNSNDRHPNAPGNEDDDLPFDRA